MKAAAATIPVHVLLPVTSVTSAPTATVCIHDPTFDTRAADQISAKFFLRSGCSDDRATQVRIGMTANLWGRAQPFGSPVPLVEEMGGAVVTDSRRADLDLQAVEGNDTFEDLFQAHKGYAYRLALLLCGGDTATAEDAVSEAFAQVLPRWRAGGIDDFGAYVRRAVVNQVKRTFLRRGFQRRSEAMLDAGPSHGPEEQVVRRQTVWAALRSLPAKQRTAVVLHYYEALPVDEVAYVMGTSVGTAKSHLSRGRDRLRELLGDRP